MSRVTYYGSPIFGAVLLIAAFNAYLEGGWWKVVGGALVGAFAGTVQYRWR